MLERFSDASRHRALLNHLAWRPRNLHRNCHSRHNSGTAGSALAGAEAQNCNRNDYCVWKDALQTLKPDQRIYTFWDYFRNAWGRDAGLRLDHILLSPSVAGRLRNANVDRHVRGWDKPSDHAPLWVELDA